MLYIELLGGGVTSRYLSRRSKNYCRDNHALLSIRINYSMIVSDGDRTYGFGGLINLFSDFPSLSSLPHLCKWGTGDFPCKPSLPSEQYIWSFVLFQWSESHFIPEALLPSALQCLAPGLLSRDTHLYLTSSPEKLPKLREYRGSSW